MIHMSFRRKDPSEKIKEATLNLLAEKGYDAISMRKIAKEADVALGQLTYYYQTKEKLIVSVISESLDFFYNEFENKVKNSDNKLETISEGVKIMLEEDTKIDRLLITVLSQSQNNKKLKEILNKFWSNIIEFMANCYKKEIEGISEEDANLKARYLAGGIMENIIEEALGISFETNKDVILIDKVVKRLGE